MPHRPFLNNEQVKQFQRVACQFQLLHFFFFRDQTGPAGACWLLRMGPSKTQEYKNNVNALFITLKSKKIKPSIWLGHPSLYDNLAPLQNFLRSAWDVLISVWEIKAWNFLSEKTSWLFYMLHWNEEQLYVRIVRCFTVLRFTVACRILRDFQIRQ